MSTVPPIKITFIGETCVGKSSLVRRIVQGNYMENAGSTIGAAFCTLRYPDRKNGRLYHFWDTAGQERYGALIPLYLSGSAVIVIVYDVTSRSSFDRIERYWIPFIRQNLRLREDDQMPMMFLIGNKCDVSSKREVLEVDGKHFADSNGMQFMEASAKTGHNSLVLLEAIAAYADASVVQQGNSVSGVTNGGTVTLVSNTVNYVRGCCSVL